jgi:N-acetylmuramoyl-L-alanine amidase
MQYRATANTSASRTSAGGVFRRYGVVHKGDIITRTGISPNGKAVKFRYAGKDAWAVMSKLEPVTTPATPAPIKPPAVVSRGKIALDIGHGQHNRTRGVYDSGATGGGTQEHKEVEEFVDALATDLMAAGYQVLVLEDMALAARDDKAKAWGAKQLISFHINSGGGTGTEVYYPAFSVQKGKASRMSSAIANALQLKNRGAKASPGFALLRAIRNSMLVEFYFIDSGTDRSHWAKYHDAARGAVLKAIMNG